MPQTTTWSTQIMVRNDPFWWVSIRIVLDQRNVILRSFVEPKVLNGSFVVTLTYFCIGLTLRSAKMVCNDYILSWKWSFRQKKFNVNPDFLQHCHTPYSWTIKKFNVTRLKMTKFVVLRWCLLYNHVNFNIIMKFFYAGKERLNFGFSSSMHL